MVGFAKSDVEPTLGVKMASAGLAGVISDLITFPLDTAKVRLQIQGEGTNTVASGGMLQIGKNQKYRGMIHTLITIGREEGPRCLYNGLVPGLQRQLAFCAVRIGAYDSIKAGYMKLFQQKADGGPHVAIRIMAGATTGCLAVAVAQPTDVVKIRMQAQSSGPRRYSGCMNAYRTIGRVEGIKGLWKGTSANIARMTIVNAAELVSYDLIKENILRYNLLSDNLPCHFVSAFGAGFCTTVVASPVDVVKTRFMNSGAGVYKGVFDCAFTMFKTNGPFAFYKGFMPNFMRLASWNICMFVAYEQLKRAFMLSFNGLPDGGSVRTPALVPASSNIVLVDRTRRESDL